MTLNDAALSERKRLEAQHDGREDWRLWGPYLAERAWGTVREDYSPGGTAWEHLDHDQARSRAYRWNEDGLAGFCNRFQNLCLSLALWNGRDPYLKERLFGLANEEGNHGEDVKEYYYYLDGVPSHAFMRMLYFSTISICPRQFRHALHAALNLPGGWRLNVKLASRAGLRCSGNCLRRPPMGLGG